MPPGDAAQRRKAGRKKDASRVVRLHVKDRLGNNRVITADLLDASSNGVGISLLMPLTVGSALTIRGNLGGDRSSAVVAATVKWCTEKINGNFHAGLELADEESTATGNSPQDARIPDEADWYEIMQLSPNADAETVARVYRILAQRYHPDSPTGNKELFLRLCEAHRVLSDPALRAQYDARHRDTQQLHWEIFDRPELPSRQEGERRKRKAILEALYAKALHNPESATMSSPELESLLGCPREHLEAALWYLRAKGCLKRADNGRFSITVAGFDAVEEVPDTSESRNLKMLKGRVQG